MRIHRKQPTITRAVQAGFSLIELMIALLIGLLVVAAAGGVFISNKRVYNASETVNRIQEGIRVGFELMSRDIREAGGNPCSASAPVINQMTSGGNDWWANWGDGIRGYSGADAMPGTVAGMGVFGTGVGQRVAGTDAVEINSALGGGIRVVDHAQPSAVVQVTNQGDIQEDDILVICNMDYSFIFQVTALPSSNQIQHNSGTSLNCAQEFQYENPCTGTGASGAFGYCFVPGATPSAQCDGFGRGPAYVARVGSVRWYVGNNARGGRSLYRATISNRSNTNTPDTLHEVYEVVEGIEDLTVTYLEAGENTYTAPAGVADWGQVVAVRIRLDMVGTEGALTASEIQGTDGQVLGRTLTHVVQLRNREAVL
ncbi:PilW family protein [Arenimonas fontis]|uniref:Prepilin-type N-terminal cleavage/methylation domain-containing protein n=1 Tax=Arenimonas fontis TaxID=2608255 RepID=A0A5B2Z9N8_9GAMM|nr:PilW family protein [Arenimonas fontis]KAA2283914.1 prepilin-type N-terminal cleavage/methylation domain-containing protein [Arenimonas fontis]